MSIQTSLNDKRNKKLDKFIKKLFNSYSYIVTIKNLQEESSWIKSKIPVLTRLLTLEDLDEYCKTSGDSREVTLGRLDKGHICWCAFFEKQVVAYVWRGLNKVWSPEIKTHLRLPKGYYYAYGAYTHPDFRGLHIFSELLSNWNAYARGIPELSRSFALISPDNAPSLKASYATGQKMIGMIKTRIIFGFPFHQVESETPEDLEIIKTCFKLNLIKASASKKAP